MGPQRHRDSSPQNGVRDCTDVGRALGVFLFHSSRSVQSGGRIDCRAGLAGTRRDGLPDRARRSFRRRGLLTAGPIPCVLIMESPKRSGFAILRSIIG
jgi:hypothetical protein